MLPFLLFVVIAASTGAQAQGCRTYNTLQMEGLQGPVKSITRKEFRARQENGRWVPDLYPTIGITTLYDTNGWMITDERNRLLDDGTSYMEREQRQFAYYPVTHIITDAPDFRSVITTSITWLSNTSYRLSNVSNVHSKDSMNEKLITYTIVNLDKQCHRELSEYYVILKDTVMLFGRKQRSGKGDTIVTTSRYGAKEYTNENTWHSIPIERDRYGNVTRLLSRRKEHYELTIYTYTYY